MTATIACVDVGQGDCTVAVDDAGLGLLIDCCSGRHSKAVAELDFLGLTELRVAIVTHSQMDHFGGVLDVLEVLADRFTGTLHFNHDSFMATPVVGPDRKVAGRKLRALLNRAGEYGERVKPAHTDCPLQTAGCIAVQLVAPRYDDIHAAIVDRDSNRASGIVLLQVGSDCIIIGGDAPLLIWERSADRLPKGCIVRWPHHGGSIGPQPNAHHSLRDLLEPSVVVVSVGAGNSYGHPTPAFFEALGGRPGKLLCTQATPAAAPARSPSGVAPAPFASVSMGLDEPTSPRPRPTTQPSSLL